MVRRSTSPGTAPTATRCRCRRSRSSADVDRFELVNKILGDGQQAEYVAKNREALEEQTKAFYGRLITSIDPGADVAYTFATDS